MLKELRRQTFTNADNILVTYINIVSTVEIKAFNDVLTILEEIKSIYGDCCSIHLYTFSNKFYDIGLTRLATEDEISVYKEYIEACKIDKTFNLEELLLNERKEYDRLKVKFEKSV